MAKKSEPDGAAPRDSIDETPPPDEPTQQPPQRSSGNRPVGLSRAFEEEVIAAGQSSDLMAVLIDGANLFYAASYLNIEIDYVRLLQVLTHGRRLLRAYFYTGVDPRNEKQRGFLLWLSRHGYRVISKELVPHPDGGRKANLHVEMSVDMLRLAKYCRTISVLSGDGHLTYALDALGRQGVTIEVISLQSMTSDALIDLADRYIDLANLQDDIKKRRKV
ncbi:MAG: NYN domain-containing protein [Cyanobacteria bacterium P01_A01_bin.114]